MRGRRCTLTPTPNIANAVFGALGCTISEIENEHKTYASKFSRIIRRKLIEGKKNGSLPQDRGKECQTLKIGSMNVEGLSYQSSIAVQDLLSTEKHDVSRFS